MSELHIAVMPLALVDDLALDFTHASVGLGFGCAALHHAGDVEVLNDAVLELVNQLCCHLALGVATGYTDRAQLDKGTHGTEGMRKASRDDQSGNT